MEARAFNGPNMDLNMTMRVNLNTSGRQRIRARSHVSIRVLLVSDLSAEILAKSPAMRCVG